ncbi:MAG: hypothetical protein M9919_04990 [Burkholderiaceae bacterium]|jgi:hypothetical protein|nr:hypothetical protein [Burkholderiaceae bacterium]MCO5103344.1 hypothetical protein [Burkholderiaceae bacterium]
MKKLAFAAFAFAALGAQAATSVGTLDNVVGNVSVGGQGVVAQAKNGMPLADGSTVLVSSKGMATVAMANGCTISLMGSQHFTVNSKLSCEQSIASIKSLAATTRLAQAPLGTGTAGAAGGSGAGSSDGLQERNVVLGGLLIGGTALLLNNSNDKKASGS